MFCSLFSVFHVRTFDLLFILSFEYFYRLFINSLKLCRILNKRSIFDTENATQKKKAKNGWNPWFIGVSFRFPLVAHKTCVAFLIRKMLRKFCIFMHLFVYLCITLCITLCKQLYIYNFPIPTFITFSLSNP